MVEQVGPTPPRAAPPRPAPPNGFLTVASAAGLLQVFMLLHKSCVRAISMLNGTGATMLLHHVTSDLLAPEGAFCKEMAKRWRRDEVRPQISAVS
jgi:hypothetical protein